MTRNGIGWPTGVVAVALLWSPAAFGQLTRIEKLHGQVSDQVKGETDFGCAPGPSFSGEVILKGETVLILRYLHDPKKPPVDIVFHAVDVLREGGLHKSADGADSYLWADVKEGDTITLSALIERGGDRSFCTELCITRRPGGKLPPAQRPKKDRRYEQDRILNDVENGENVSDADIAKHFPLRKSNETNMLVAPAGLPPSYQTKLNTNRERIQADQEKKEQGLKAPPPAKKEK